MWNEETLQNIEKDQQGRMEEIGSEDLLSLVTGGSAGGIAVSALCTGAAFAAIDSAFAAHRGENVSKAAETGAVTGAAVGAITHAFLR